MNKLQWLIIIIYLLLGYLAFSQWLHIVIAIPIIIFAPLLIGPLLDNLKDRPTAEKRTDK